jgi:hypothetical protein
MAFQSGTQVNAALGRTDFTPFLQGALQGAQAQARGGELLGQGLAGLGQQVATGIEKYYKKEEEKGIEQQGVEFIKSNVPGIDDKAARAGLKAAGGAAAFVNFMSSQRQSQETAKQKQEVDSLTEILRQGGGTIPSPISNQVAKSFSPSTLSAAREQFLKQSKMEAEINKLNAESMGKPIEGEIMTSSQIEAIEKTGKKVDTTPVGVDRFRVTKITTFATPQKPYPSTAEQLSFESGKAAIASGAEFVKATKTAYDDANSQFESASLINSALQSGKTTTGLLAKSSGLLKNIGETLFGGDFGAAEQQLFTKGVSGFGLAGVRKLFRGLGAMSDGDRARGESTVMSITDPQKSIEYYTEVAKLNQEYSRDDVNFINKLQRAATNADEIQRQVEERKMNRPSISDQAYQIVFPKSAGEGKVIRVNY